MHLAVAGLDLPESVRARTVEAPKPSLDCDFVFSSLPSSIAREVEIAFASAGYPVISNSSACRMDEDVPLLIPEVNAEHLGLLNRQRVNRGFNNGGFIVTNPNCAAVVLTPVLAVLPKSSARDERGDIIGSVTR